MVEYVEALNPELQTDSLGNSKVLEEGHVRKPLLGAKEGVSAKVSRAPQARLGKDTAAGIPLRTPAVGPHIVASATEAREWRIRTPISGVAVRPIKQVIATDVLAISRVYVSCRARSSRI